VPARWLLAVTAAFALLGSGVAQAADPIRLTAGGGSVDVAVDAAGTGHFVWNEGRLGDADITHYCRIPRGAKACQGEQTVIPPADGDGKNNGDVDGPKVFLTSSGGVQILTHRCCGFKTLKNDTLFLYTSTDGGATFGAPAVLGANLVGGAQRAIAGPGGAISTIGGATSGTFYRLSPLGANTTTEANLDESSEFDQWFGGTVGLFDATTPVAAFFDITSGKTESTVFFRKYKGSGDHNTPGNWTPAEQVGPGSDTILAGGQSGLHLLHLSGTPGKQRYVDRRFDGTRFGAPTGVTEVGSPIFADFFQEAGGRLQALWRGTSRALSYRFSIDGGATWEPIQSLVSSGDFFNLQVATGPDGQGFGVWDSNGDRTPAFAIPLGPADPATGPRDEKSVTVGSTVLTLQSPKACVAATNRIVAKLKVRAKKRKGRVVVKVSRVDFRVDGGRKKLDTKAPFSARLVLTGLKPRTTHTISGRAFLKVRHGPQRSRTIRNRFRIC